jgi:thiol-disulfide isomerase/thioredoxin
MRPLLTKSVLAVFVALAALVWSYQAGLFSKQTSSKPTSQAGISPGALYALSLSDLNGKPQNLGQWTNKPLVLNFWATWCAPCMEEIPLFIQAQNKYAQKGLQFVGIGIDNPEKMRALASQTGINYPLLAGQDDGMAFSGRCGNTLNILPFTAFIDRGGQIVEVVSGSVSEAKLEQLLAKIM